MTLSELREWTDGNRDKYFGTVQIHYAKLQALIDAAEALARQRRNMIRRAETTGPALQMACVERLEIDAEISAALSALRDAGLEVT